MLYKIVERISYIARVAGLEILRIYTGNLKLHMYSKFDKSLVTNADLVAHRVITRALYSLTPNIPILSEEYLPEWKRCRDWNCFWLIDPLDGTKEFLSHNGEFTVNIALVEKGYPVMGVIYVPVYNLLYASDNGCVWKINRIGKRSNITIQVSHSPVVVVSRNHDVNYHQNKLYNYLINLKNHKIFFIGSSFKFCLIAEGNAQCYPRFSCTKIWDTAAGHSIVESAGAMISDWHGNPLNYKNINRYFLNPGFQVSSMVI